jgi:MFS family permease
MKELWRSLGADKKIALAIITAALGYFVDVYDLVLFSILRVASLKDLHVAPEDMLRLGAHLLNAQLAGFLIGGLVWGIIGDRIGRTHVLFGSILLYSAANLANAFVTATGPYALCRLLAGIGLAGEIGAGITLVSELMPKEVRGYGTTIVATVGVMGGMVAGFTGHFLHWQTAYIVGGILGFGLLALRVAVSESGLFERVKEKAGVARGNFLMLLHPSRFFRYLACIFIAMPTWYGVAVLVTFAPEIGRALAIRGEVQVAAALPFCYLGITLGDFASGMLSQLWGSRKKAIALFCAGGAAVTSCLPLLHGGTPALFYAFCTALGFCLGFWVLMLTVAAEQFGTNLRATVATSVPNFVRATGILCTSSFAALRPLGTVESALIVGAGSFAVAALALAVLRETFGRDLDFIEEPYSAA